MILKFFKELSNRNNKFLGKSLNNYTIKSNAKNFINFYQNKNLFHNIKNNQIINQKFTILNYDENILIKKKI